jgi:hypothetical protein
MLRTLKRAKSAIERHGLGGLTPLLVHNLKHYWRNRGSRPQSIRHQFDEQFQVETERISEIGVLDIESPNAKYAKRYEPSAPKLVRRVLSSLKICYGDFTFIDFGAGKGRVLLIASEFPFARILGVEFSAELVQAARENVRRFRSPQQKTTQIDVVHEDVTKFDVPKTPLICYFYNPFQKAILARVASRLRLSMEASQRDIYVVYVQPEHRDVFENSEMWAPCLDDPLFVGYRLVMASKTN